MRAARVSTPLGIRVGAVVFVVAVCGWWLADWHDRTVNEHRLAAIASVIAGREVKVHCPGPLSRAFEYQPAEGTVQFDAEGRPADETQLRKHACAELDALAEGRRTAELACVERSTSCGDDAARLAFAVDTLAHESVHMSGNANEGETECRSMQLMAWTAMQLGTTEAQGRALAQLHFEVDYPLMGDTYHAAGCADGGALDMHPDDPRFP
jgi:hypothetical protein